MADDEAARAIGMRIWRVRDKRRMSLRAVGELAGLSKDVLNRIERGERSPTFAEIRALADALQISASELTRLPVPAPANGHTDSTIEAVRKSLTAVDYGRPGGQVLPLDLLRSKVAEIQALRKVCKFAEVATLLPGLIRDLHTTLANGKNVSELMQLAVYLHVQVTSMWLLDAGAPLDLRREVTTLARRIARECGEGFAVGTAALAVGDLIFQGQYELARSEIDAVPPLVIAPGTASLAGGLLLRNAIVAVADSRLADSEAALDAAADLANRFGETGEEDLGFAFGPTDVGLYRMKMALEAEDLDNVVATAQRMQPERHPFLTRQATYWRYKGRALTRLQGHPNDAVAALLRAETLFPTGFHRDRVTRDTIVELLPQTRVDSPAGQELRQIAKRAYLL